MYTFCLILHNKKEKIIQLHNNIKKSIDTGFENTASICFLIAQNLR